MGSAQDESKRLHRLNQEIATSIVFSEIAIGMTYCKIAASGGAAYKLRALQLARNALEIADNWMFRIHLEHPEFNRMTAETERLRFELESLSEP